MPRFQIRQTRMKRKLGKLMKEALPPHDVDLPRVVLGSRPLADISVKDRLVADETAFLRGHLLPAAPLTARGAAVPVAAGS